MEAEQKFKVHLGILLFSFIVVVIALFFTNKFLKTEVDPKAYPRPIIIDNKFIDPWLGFSIQSPSPQWQIEQRAVQSTFIEEDTLQSIYANMQPVVELRKQVDSTDFIFVEVAALKLKTNRNALSLSERALNNFLTNEKYGTITIVQNPAKNTGGRYEAAWFALRSSNEKKDNIWIVTTALRDSIGYIITACLDAATYENQKSDIEAIISSFRLHDIPKELREYSDENGDYEF
ncbi:MAG: hypothetical protein H6696_17285 [Deferribacteres bacterium]|nr:hypothetical protein [candidate division KSB1 bacterium]MCB9503690.1 hypothetical protein [Deferribacteres bacterium]